MPNQVRLGVGVTGAKGAASEMDRLRDRVEKLQQTSAKGFAIGAGAALATAGINALGTAVQGVVGWLGESSDAFRENEVSVTQLTASLRANVPAWEGQTAAIEEAIAAGQKLAFDDELQREALTKLVGAYGNVTKAIESHRLAMDLARFSGMGLLEASQLLINVHAGNFRGLRQLGISTKNVKTETQALGLIFEKVGGQAEAYAETDLGKVEAANIRLEESQERLGESMSKIGAVVFPALADAVEGATDAVEEAWPAVEFLHDAILGLVDPMQVVEDRARRDAEATYEAGAGVRYMAGATKDDLIPSLEDAADETEDLTDEMTPLEAALKDVREEVEKLDAAFGRFTDAEYDATIAAGEIAQAHQDLTELLDEEPVDKSSEEWVIWAGKVADARQSLFDLQYEMKKSEGPAALQLWLTRVRDGLAETDVKGRALLDTLIKLNAKAVSLEFMAGASKDDTYVPPAKSPPTSTPPATSVPTTYPDVIPISGTFASGTDWVPRDMVAQLHQGEAVIPASQNRQTGGGSMTINHNVTVTAPGVLTPSHGAAIAREIGVYLVDYLNRRGYGGRTGAAPLAG